MVDSENLADEILNALLLGMNVDMSQVSQETLELFQRIRQNASTNVAYQQSIFQETARKAAEDQAPRNAY